MTAPKLVDKGKEKVIYEFLNDIRQLPKTRIFMPAPDKPGLHYTKELIDLKELEDLIIKHLGFRIQIGG